jgi:hypothetical protein
MLLYVNGDSHTAGAEAVNPYVFACDDGTGDMWRWGKRPHPDNERVSWGYQLSNRLECDYINDSESASSNYRIMRTTRDWIKDNSRFWSDLLVVIQWSTWERQEWLIDGEYYQVNASGVDEVPANHQLRYKQWIIDIDWTECTRFWHDEIWRLHQELRHWGIRHLFFNGNSHFGDLDLDKHDWQNQYLDPYSVSGTYDQILRQNSFQTVNETSWHFGSDAHCFWAKYLLQYISANKI